VVQDVLEVVLDASREVECELSLVPHESPELRVGRVGVVTRVVVSLVQRGLDVGDASSHGPTYTRPERIEARVGGHVRDRVERPGLFGEPPVGVQCHLAPPEPPKQTGC